MKRLLVELIGNEGKIDFASLCRQLGELGAEVLDLNQSVVFDRLYLGLFIASPERLGLADLDTLLRANPDLRHGELHLAEVSETEHQLWLEERGLTHFSVTVLAPGLSARALAAVSTAIRSKGMRITSIRRISGYPEPGEGSIVCVELGLRGRLADELSLRQTLLAMAPELKIDLGMQQDDMYRRHRRLVAFDMDATLIQIEVIEELAALAGVREQVEAITAAAMNGELDFEQSLRRRVKLLAGLEQSAVVAVADHLPLSAGVETLLATLKTLQYKTAILTGGFDCCAERLQQHLGIDWIHANHLEFRDGKVTGELLPPIIDSEAKAFLLQQLAQQQGLDMRQVIAVGDGANDLPMISSAGLGIAFSTRPAVLRSAQHSLSMVGLDAILYLIGAYPNPAIGGIMPLGKGA